MYRDTKLTSSSPHPLVPRRRIEVKGSLRKTGHVPARDAVTPRVSGGKGMTQFQKANFCEESLGVRGDFGGLVHIPGARHQTPPALLQQPLLRLIHF